MKHKQWCDFIQKKLSLIWDYKLQCQFEFLLLFPHALANSHLNRCDLLILGIRGQNLFISFPRQQLVAIRLCPLCGKQHCIAQNWTTFWFFNVLFWTTFWFFIALFLKNISYILNYNNVAQMHCAELNYIFICLMYFFLKCKLYFEQ